MPDDTPGSETGDTQFLTPEDAAPLLEAFLFPAEADTNDTHEPTPDAEAAADDSADADAAPEADADAESHEDADDAEAESEESQETDDETPQPRKYRVKIADAEEEVTEDELVKGYMRHADYTRKRMADAEQEKAREADYTAVREERQRYAAALQQLEEALADPAPPDWVKLRAELPPEQFAAEWATWQQAEQQRAAVRTERQQAEAKVREDRQKQLAQTLAAERAKLLEAIPDWQDEAKATAEHAALVTFAKGKGYTDADLAAVTDHRVIVLLRNAMLWENAMKQKPTVEKKAAPKVKTATPGGGSTAARKQPTEAERAANRLAKYGRVEDAAKVFEQFVI